jgi:hypothetical protein
MRSELDAMVQLLLARDESVVSLDAIGETIGAERISQIEIEELFAEIEKAGRTIGGPTPQVRQYLHLVIDHARRLKGEQETTPNVSAIAEATGITVGQVRAALLYASVLGR